MPFYTGDKIACYWVGVNGVAKRAVRTVHSINGAGNLETQTGDSWHPKQCRRIKKKERCRIWVKALGDRTYEMVSLVKQDQLDWTEFVEVKVKEK